MIEQLSCHNLNLQVRHLCIAKRLLCYLKGIIIYDIKWRMILQAIGQAEAMKSGE